MHDRAKNKLEELIQKSDKLLTEDEKFFFRQGFIEGYEEGRHPLSIEEALKECRKWRMSDEEEKQLLE